MQVGAISTASYQRAGAADSFSKMDQAFQKLGSALESGNLSDAKEALAQLQKNAPTKATQGSDPLNTKMEALSKAVDSGDLTAARKAYSDIKETMAQSPSAGSSSGTGRGGAKQSSGAAGGSSSAKSYDKMDLNQDGTVTAIEEAIYNLKHPAEVDKTSTTTKSDTADSSVDVTA